MKQATLKRSAPSKPSPKKRPKTVELAGAGTVIQPFDLDDIDNRESPIDVDADDSEDTATQSGPSGSLKALGKGRKGPESGPTTADPLNINEPSFDVQATFTDVKPEVILKDPDLDLLYFKRMSKCFLD